MITPMNQDTSGPAAANTLSPSEADFIVIIEFSSEHKKISEMESFMSKND